MESWEIALTLIYLGLAWVSFFMMLEARSQNRDAAMQLRDCKTLVKKSTDVLELAAKYCDEMMMAKIYDDVRTGGQR